VTELNYHHHHDHRRRILTFATLLLHYGNTSSGNVSVSFFAMLAILTRVYGQGSKLEG
jgi:hypothetical protein